MSIESIQSCNGVFISFRDRLSGLYSPPLVFPTVPVFERQLRLVMQRPADPQRDPLWHQFPNDHDICIVAGFDDRTGKVVVEPDCPRFLGHVSDYLDSSEVSKDE